MMRYELLLPARMIDELHQHLLQDRSQEQMAVTLCGVARSRERVQLLGRHLITVPRDGFAYQSATGLTLDPVVQRHVLELAAREGLSQIDWHTHPGDRAGVAFSPIDDRHERELATYVAERMPGTFYGSVVLNGAGMDSRLWEVWHGRAEPVSLEIPDASRLVTEPSTRGSGSPSQPEDRRFDRQVRAFGVDFQRRLRDLSVGLVGVGGLGSVIAEQLVRLGVRDWVLVDPDIIDSSNLNRLLGATVDDVQEERRKVDVAARTIHRVEPRVRIQSIPCSVFAPRALKVLTDCDLLIAATDDDSSRLVLNALAAQYLRPLVHVGVNLDPHEGDGFADISGEVAIPPFGTWCLACARIVDPQRATWELASREERGLLRARGYLSDTPAPAVYHLNGIAASLAVTEIHNLIWPYKPLRRYLVYRELESELMPIEVPRQESCLHCSPDGGRLGLGDLRPLWQPRPGQHLMDLGLPDAGPDEEAGPSVEEAWCESRT